MLSWVKFSVTQDEPVLCVLPLVNYMHLHCTSGLAKRLDLTTHAHMETALATAMAAGFTCTHKCIKLYTLNMCGSLCAKYTEVV